MKVILALDQGTTSSRALVFDQAGAVLAVVQRELSQYYPQPGWVEHDPLEIWETQLDVARQALRECHLTPTDVAAIGIANQRETTLIWNRKTGEPIHNAIVWQDRRTADDCQSWVQKGYSELVQQKTGLLIDAYFCMTKLRWLLDHVPRARAEAERGELAFGTVDSWLLWNLTGGALHATDITNASRSMLLNIDTGEWDDELLALFGVPRALLPSVLPSSHLYGETDPTLFGGPIAIGGVAGDQQAALFGQNCTRSGMAKNTYGTGCFLLLNVGEMPHPSTCRLLTTFACGIGERREYALEGSIFVAGAVVQWLRDGLGIINSSAEVEALAATVPDTGGVYFVPAFAGLGAPHWDAYARGTMVGLTRGTTRAHIARAALEGIAFQVADVLDAMKRDASIVIEELRVDGGAAANDLLLQFQADILQVSVVRPQVIETTALGAAYLAGLSSRFWRDVCEIAKVWKVDRRFEPTMLDAEVATRRQRWKGALERARSWESVGR